MRVRIQPIAQQTLLMIVLMTKELKKRYLHDTPTNK